MNKKIKISILVLALMLVGTSILVIPTGASGTATATLTPNTTSVEKGELFTVALWIDTGNNITKGFTIRRLVFNTNLIQLTNISFGNLYQANCDNEENRTRIMSTLNTNGTDVAYINGGDVFGDGFTGNNIAVIFKFIAIQIGKTDIEIPLTFWNGLRWVPGLEVVYIDSTTWTNTNIEITDSGGNGGNGGNGGGPPPPPPPTNIPPVANGAGPYVAFVNESITVDASGSYDPDGEIVSYLWIFSDGTNSTEMITNHTYVLVGNYSIKLTVTDDDGNISIYYTYAFITKEKEPEEPEEPEEPVEPDDNETEPVTPTEFPMVYVGIALLIILIILTIVWIIGRRKGKK